jgi:hypothetical protein
VAGEEKRDRCQTEKPIKPPNHRDYSRHHPRNRPHHRCNKKPAPDNIKSSRRAEIAKPNLKHEGDDISTPIRDCTDCMNKLTALLG